MDKEKMKKKIFVSAYACEPNLGSEIGVGWRWVLEMSKYFDLWVLTRSSNKKSIEPWIEEHPQFKNIQFLYYDLPDWAKWWKKGQRGVRIYYNLWQWLSEQHTDIPSCNLRQCPLESKQLWTKQKIHLGTYWRIGNYSE